MRPMNKVPGFHNTRQLTNLNIQNFILNVHTKFSPQVYNK